MLNLIAKVITPHIYMLNLIAKVITTHIYMLNLILRSSHPHTTHLYVEPHCKGYHIHHLPIFRTILQWYSHYQSTFRSTLQMKSNPLSLFKTPFVILCLRLRSTSLYFTARQQPIKSSDYRINRLSWHVNGWTCHHHHSSCSILEVCLELTVFTCVCHHLLST